MLLSAKSLHPLETELNTSATHLTPGEGFLSGESFRTMTSSQEGLLSTLPDEWKQLSEQASPSALLTWALGQWSAEEITLACSLGVEDLLLVELWEKLGGKRVFVLDTGRLHPETYNLLHTYQQASTLQWEIYAPQAEAVQELVQSQGINGFFRSVEARRACCHVRKVEPLKRALAGSKAWITGLRREQSSTRQHLQGVEFNDPVEGIVKLNPLAFWTEEQVWNEARAQNLLTNPLHQQGFPSIGCQPCTRAIAPGEDVRAGRWWWESPEHKECGLHGRTLRSAS